MTKRDKALCAILAAAVGFVIMGLLFLLSAAEILVVFDFFLLLENVLIRYIIVIVTMACGIMTFSIASGQLSNKKVSNGLTIGATVFSTVLTIPLVYVFCAIFSAHKGVIDPIGKVLMLDQIVAGFVEWFGDGTLVYVAYSAMLILSLIFVIVPIVTCVQTVIKNNKIIKAQPTTATQECLDEYASGDDDDDDMITDID